jgi:predicted Fe-Mo cluster-binding NifX family protein
MTALGGSCKSNVKTIMGPFIRCERIAVTTQGDDLNAEIDSRFGRAPKFLVVDTETMRFDVAANTQSLDLAQGAGIQSAQNVLTHKPDVVLTGTAVPKPFACLRPQG